LSVRLAPIDGLNRRGLQVHRVIVSAYDGRMLHFLGVTFRGDRRGLGNATATVGCDGGSVLAGDSAPYLEEVNRCDKLTRQVRVIVMTKNAQVMRITKARI
jgi:hypothetical protein